MFCRRQGISFQGCGSPGKNTHWPQYAIKTCSASPGGKRPKPGDSPHCQLALRGPSAPNCSSEGWLNNFTLLCAPHASTQAEGLFFIPGALPEEDMKKLERDSPWEGVRHLWQCPALLLSLLLLLGAAPAQPEIPLPTPRGTISQQHHPCSSTATTLRGGTRGFKPLPGFGAVCSIEGVFERGVRGADTPSRVATASHR